MGEICSFKKPLDNKNFNMEAEKLYDDWWGLTKKLKPYIKKFNDHCIAEIF